MFIVKPLFYKNQFRKLLFLSDNVKVTDTCINSNYDNVAKWQQFPLDRLCLHV